MGLSFSYLSCRGKCPTQSKEGNLMNISMENELTEKIAELLDEYLETEIEDLTNINNLVQLEKKMARVRQRKENILNEINGGSK